MRAVIFNGPGKAITVEQVDDPTPAPTEVVVKIARCGICGSDISLTSPSPFACPPGIGLGHEYAGEVVAVGRDVSDIKVGTRVACMPAVGCGECRACRTGANPIFCTAKQPASRTNGFADYAAVPSRGVVPLPQSLSFADGALVEPMACGLHALRMARMRGDERILVLGAGAMAVSLVYWARELGAGTVVALSRSAHRRELLLAMGADIVCDFDAETALIEEALGGVPDIVVDCVGKVGMLKKAIDHVRPQGTVLSLGICTHEEPILGGLCAFKEIRLLFPMGWTTGEFIETVKAFDAGRIKPDTMVSDVIALDAVPHMIESLRAGAKSLKVQVDPSLVAARA